MARQVCAKPSGRGVLWVGGLPFQGVSGLCMNPWLVETPRPMQERSLALGVGQLPVTRTPVREAAKTRPHAHQHPHQSGQPLRCWQPCQFKVSSVFLLWTTFFSCFCLSVWRLSTARAVSQGQHRKLHQRCCGRSRSSVFAVSACQKVQPEGSLFRPAVSAKPLPGSSWCCTVLHLVVLLSRQAPELVVESVAPQQVQVCCIALVRPSTSTSRESVCALLGSSRELSAEFAAQLFRQHSNLFHQQGALLFQCCC